MTPEWPAWKAQWIWLATPPWSVWEAPSTPPPSTWNRVVHLRRSLRVDDVPQQAWARLTADSRFVLCVNGVECARGPARSLPARLAVSTVDLAPLLRRGENVLAATVRFYGRANPWYRPAQPLAGMGAGGFLFEAPTLGVVSDSEWRARQGAHVAATPAPQNLPLEIVDGRREARGWMLPGFDDAGWVPAAVLSGGGGMSSPPADPYTALEPAGIPALTAVPVRLSGCGEVPVIPVSSADPLAAWPPQLGDPGGERLLLFDAGGETLATPWVRVRGDAGAVVDMYAGEQRDERGLPAIEPRRYAARYILGGTAEERFEPLEAVGFRHLAVVLRGPVELLECGAVERRQPRSGEATFSCDDATLDRVWHAGARTAELCATDALIDCPGREQRSWLGDLAVSGLVGLSCGIDPSVLRRSLRIAAHSQRSDGLLAMASVGDVSLQAITIPEFSLHWLRALRVYLRRTGDLATVRELMPTATEVIVSLDRYRGDDGLLHHLPGWTWVDWAQTERGEVNGAVNALWVAALDDHAQLARRCGEGSGASHSAHLAIRARHGFEQLWDEARGVYVDALDDGVRGRRVSQQTNAAAIVWVGVSGERAARILARVLDDHRLVVTPTPADVAEHLQLVVQSLRPSDFVRFDDEESAVAAQPFFMHTVHEAMARCGRHQAIIDSCRRWAALLDEEHDTIGEYWSSPPPQASACHVFSCTPVHDLVHHVLGLQVLSSSRLRFSPHLGDLAHARGTVVTPHGTVSAEATRDAGARIVVPAGVSVDVPSGDRASAPRRLGPGEHEIRLQPAYS